MSPFSPHALRAVALTGVGTILLACSGGGTARSASADDSSRVVPAAPVAQSAAVAATSAADTNTLIVYKSASCGCCKSWVEHMERAGFKVVVHDTEELQGVKDESGVPAELRSCHTAMIGAYVIEGHVPATDVRRLLRERPAVAGLAVPGMPSGSPGMEGGVSERYDVMTFGGPSAQRVFAHH
jgi:hypothetical protein